MTAVKSKRKRLADLDRARRAHCCAAADHQHNTDQANQEISWKRLTTDKPLSYEHNTSWYARGTCAHCKRPIEAYYRTARNHVIVWREVTYVVREQP